MTTTQTPTTAPDFTPLTTDELLLLQDKLTAGRTRYLLEHLDEAAWLEIFEIGIGISILIDQRLS